MGRASFLKPGRSGLEHLAAPQTEETAGGFGRPLGTRCGRISPQQKSRPDVTPLSAYQVKNGPRQEEKPRGRQ